MDDAAALELAKRAAFRGGRVALAKLGDPGYLTWKGQRDVVTGATLEVQQAIVSVLQNECPDDAILVEEGPEDEPLAVDAERLWIVDPICGTLSFAQGIPFFAVSIALRVEGVLRVGVVYDPIRDETFAATLGAPATLNNRPITAAEQAELRATFDAICATLNTSPTGFLHAAHDRATFDDSTEERLAFFEQMSRRGGSTRTGRSTRSPGTSPPPASSCRRPAA